MRPVYSWVFASLLAFILVGCTTTTSEIDPIFTPTITTVPSIIPTQTQVRASTQATNTVVAATTMPTEVVRADSSATPDQMAFVTAEGYHAFGDPSAPVVMFDYSDFF